VISVSVLGRDETFDPQVDPVVRIEASQLRCRLERYYLTGGVGSRIRIDLPKGSYVPNFTRTNQSIPKVANLDNRPVRRGKAVPVSLSAGVLASAGLAIALMVRLGSPSTWTLHPVPTVQINSFVPVDAFSAEMASGLQDEVRRALMGNNHLPSSMSNTPSSRHPPIS
jgi:hypothetical protein